MNGLSLYLLINILFLRNHVNHFSERLLRMEAGLAEIQDRAFIDFLGKEHKCKGTKFLLGKSPLMIDKSHSILNR